MIRELEALAGMEFSLLTERRRHPPAGAAGGSPGLRGRNLLVSSDDSVRELASKAMGRLRVGERLRIETPGGGGYGASEASGPLTD